jgi:Ner family transcriptional regulator
MSEQEPREAQDWHIADIKAALEKKGWTLRKLSASKGYASNTLGVALHRKWPSGEKIIADAIGVEPKDIWPSRYKKDI